MLPPRAMCPPGVVSLSAITHIPQVPPLTARSSLLAAFISHLPPPWAMAQPDCERAEAVPGGSRGPLSPLPGGFQAWRTLLVRLCLPVCVSVSVLDVVAAAWAPGH